MMKSSFWRFFKRFVVLCFMALCIIPGFADNITTSPANCNSTTLNTSTGPATLNADWEANNINIAWYSDGTQITNDANAATQCTYDQTFSLPSPPTKTGYNFAGWKVRGLPDGYTQLEYIESTGTQYIDTGIQVKGNTYAEFEYQYTSTSGTNYVFGQVAGSSGKIMGWRSNRIWWYTSTNVSLLDTLKHSVDFKSDGKVYLDGGVVANRGTFSGSPQSQTILLFAERNDNNTINKGRVKIYKFKLKEDDSDVGNYVPARRNSDNVVGMYDTVTGQFYTNAGSGNFEAGPAAQ